MLFAKGLKSYNAILGLCEGGYGEDAAIVLRALFQTAVTARYLTQRDFRERYARYQGYQWVLTERLLKPRIEAGRMTPPKYIKGEQYSWKQIQAFARRARTRFGNMSGAMGWTGYSLEQVARSLGYQEAYDSLYRHTSEYEHASLRAARTYAQGRQGRVATAVTSKPSNHLVDETLATLYWVVLVLIEVMDKVFRLKKKPRMTSSLQTFESLVRSQAKAGG